MDISIIIVNYNTYTLTVNCIKSIYEKTVGLEFEIIVVDNCSPDRAIERLNIDFPKVKLILSQHNKGFGAGNNLGATIAKGKYLLFLNSDTLLLNNAVKEFYKYMERNPRVGICGGNLYQVDLRPGVSFERRLPGILRDFDNLLFMFLSKLQFGKNLVFNFEDRSLRLKGYVSGADLCIPKELFMKVGRFDEDFFMYYEETELTHRVFKAKKEVHVIPQSKIIHLEGGSQEELSDKKKVWMRDSKLLYFRKTNTFGFEISNILSALICLRDSLIQKLRVR
ncbi:glycosyltransferase family 2 protein [Sphingobacterium athyrii]|uniref:Glycosyltransferase family 2 protein n=1 Tax=Sphingobacterium athyrii TaxID=2152717 RepID=A0A363NQ84_9SPHI|nr:glycosyltransferase family 2 protein [Sphingobacterium athyrii]PUV22966.1 glycosyltransferase family 2 protein [Sphingobacterium athyrii]